MKRSKLMMAVFLMPAILSYLLIFLYPTVRTFVMSFFNVSSVTSPMSTWTFVGIFNYEYIFSSTLFLRSLYNITFIWIYGGLGIMIFSLFFAIILTSGVRGKAFFRAMIYLPNVVAAVAMGTMWVHYVFQPSHGFLNSFFSKIGLTQFSGPFWLEGEMLFYSLIIAFTFGMVGYMMLILMSGMERIPEDFYEAARIEGASIVVQFFKITLPLIKGVIKNVIVLWTIAIVGFFVWSQVFSPLTPELQTVTPMIYMYQMIFGSNTFVTERIIGAGAAVGVILTLIVVAVFVVASALFKDDVEF